MLLTHAGRNRRRGMTLDQLRRQSLRRLDALSLDEAVRRALAAQSERCGIMPHVLARRLLEFATLAIIAAAGGDASVVPPLSG